MKKVFLKIFLVFILLIAAIVAFMTVEYNWTNGTTTKVHAMPKDTVTLSNNTKAVISK